MKNKQREQMILKKHIFYLFLVSAMLSLGACSSESAEDSSNDFEALEEEELETDEGAAFDWLGLTEEEKETMVVDALNEAGYGSFPSEPLITSLDEAYSSGFNMDEDFKTIFGYTLNNFQEPYMINSGDQYGDDSYTENDINRLYYVGEVDETVFTVQGNGNVGSLLYSYAKEGYWVEKDLPLLTDELLISVIQKAGLDPDIYDFFHEKLIFDQNHIYVLLPDGRPNQVKSNHILIDFLWTETGVVENGVTQNSPLNPKVVKTSSGKKAFIIYDGQGNAGIYPLEDKLENPIKTYQPSEAFLGRFDVVSHGSDHIYYFEDTGLFVVGETGIYHYDTNTGDPVWNASGQEQEYDFKLRKSVVDFYSGNLFAVADGKSNTFNIYDIYFNPQGPGITLPFAIDEDSSITSTDTSYTVWKTHKYKGKPALQFATIQKGIGAYYNAAN